MIKPSRDLGRPWATTPPPKGNTQVVSTPPVGQQGANRSSTLQHDKPIPNLSTEFTTLPSPAHTICKTTTKNWLKHHFSIRRYHFQYVEPKPYALNLNQQKPKLYPPKSLRTYPSRYWSGDIYMDGWMYGWMGGWVDGWMGGWVDGWMGGWVDVWMDVGMYVCMYVYYTTVAILASELSTG